MTLLETLKELEAEVDSLKIRLKVANEDGNIHTERAYKAEAEVERLRKDADRLDWMNGRGAWIGWNREGDWCRVFIRGEEDEHLPVCGWKRWFENHRDAIDAAMKEQP